MIMDRFSPNCHFSVQLTTGKETSFPMFYSSLYKLYLYAHTMAKLGMLMQFDLFVVFYSSVSEEYWFGLRPKWPN